MKKFFSKFKNIYLDILIIFIISCIYLYGVLININILGLKFMIPIGIVLFILCFVNIIAFKSKRLKRKIKKILSIISVLLAIIFFVIGTILLNVFSSVQNMFSTKSFVEYSVIVKKDSNYKKIKDINKKIIGFYKEDKYHDKAEKKLSKKIDAEYVGYSTIEDLEYALLNDEIDGLMLIDSYLDVLDKDEETEELVDDNTANVDKTVSEAIKNFDKKSKTIYKFKIEIDNSKKAKKIDLKEGSFAIYVSGQDSYASTVSEASRSDVNMLMIVNLKTKKILLVSIPRDYYINIKGKGASDKLTHISIYGSETAANSLGDLLDVKVEYFIKFNFTTFMKAMDYILPLDVYSDYEFTTGVYDQTIGNSYTFSEGYNHITSGEMALQFVRARKNFSEGDRQRGINQSRMLRAVINKTTTPSVLLKYKKIMKALEGTFLTNISNESITQIIKYIINNNGKFNIYSYSLDGSDAHRACYSSGSQSLYVMLPDQETIEIAKKHIKDVLDGKTPDIDTDASELADASKSSSVTKTPYKETYKSTYNRNNGKTNNNSVNNNTNNNDLNNNQFNNNTPNVNDDQYNKPNTDNTGTPTSPDVTGPEQGGDSGDGNTDEKGNTGDTGDGGETGGDVNPDPIQP